MRRVLKKLISTVAAAAVVLTAMTMSGAPGSVAEAATMENCSGNHTGGEWSGISDLSKLEAGNKYYLTQDVTLSSLIQIYQTNDVTLCLNGHTINANNQAHVFLISGSKSSFTLCDCGGEDNTQGKLFGSTASAVYINDSTFNMYGGTISENKATETGGGVYVAGGTGKFNMYGGIISDNTATNYGGGVYVYNKATFTMSGGTISDNAATNGGGVYVVGGQYAVNDTSKFIMTGGIISDNRAENGGGVYVVDDASEFIMTGGTISENHADDTECGGGGVYVSNSTFTMSGGTIYNNTSTNSGGVYVGSSGKFEMTGGTILYNGVKLSGGGVYNAGIFTMSGNSTISDNEAMQGDGGGVFSSGTFTMSGGSISRNEAGGNGGGVYVNSGTFTINEKVDISGNTKTSGSDNNVCLLPGKKISIGNDFNTFSTIGVNIYGPTSCSSYIDVTDTTPEKVNGCIKADNDDEFVFWETSDNTIKLAKKHTIENPDKIEPTCTDDGIEEGVCSACSQTITKTTPALGHDWSAWEITNDPTTTQTGTAERACSNDSSHTDTVTVPKLSDDNVWTKVDAKCVEPTETTPGKDVYISVEYGEVEVELPATGSDDNNSSGGSDDNNSSGGSDDNNSSGGSDNNNPSGGSDDNNSSGGSSDNNPSGGSSSSGSSSGGSSSSSSSSEIAPASDSQNPTTGSKIAVSSTAILAVAVMLLTKKRSR